ncbi:acetolactate synthase small subunit [Thermodesulfobacteriota bacterium]
MRHVISVLVENEFGVLSRISGLFSGRGFNIESLCVAETNDPNISSMTIVTRGSDEIIEQITKQLRKLITVVKVTDFTGTDFIDREMILIKVKATEGTRAEVLSIADIFRAKIVDVSLKSYTVELTGDESKIEAILDLFRPMGIIDLVRTGTVAISRSDKTKRTKK